MADAKGIEVPASVIKEPFDCILEAQRKWEERLSRGVHTLSTGSGLRLIEEVCYL